MRSPCWALLAVGCAAPAVKTVCEEGGLLAEDGRCYDIVDDSAAPAPEDQEQEDGDGGAGQTSTLPQLEADALRAAWDGPALVAALESAAAVGLPTPFGLTAAYAEVMAQGDSRCPANPYELDGRFLRGCTADSGAFYSGVSTWIPVHRRTEFEFGVNGDFMLFDRDGRRLEVGGGVGWQAESRDAPVIKFGLYVTAVWEGDPGPLHDGLSASLDGSLSRGAGRQALEVNGSVAFAGYAFAFRRAGFATDCVGGSGSVELRDPSLGWHRLDFGSTCTPCGTWSFEGAEMGELCVDLSPMIQTYSDAWSTL
jgi:hypothetical protein